MSRARKRKTQRTKFYRLRSALRYYFKRRAPFYEYLYVVGRPVEAVSLDICSHAGYRVQEMFHDQENVKVLFRAK